MFTLENVFDKRVEFENACKRANAYKQQYTRLIKAKTEQDFMEIVCDNICWINNEMINFEPKFDNVFDFSEGFAIIEHDISVKLGSSTYLYNYKGAH